MAKIAVELQRALANRAKNGAPGCASARVLAHGENWSATDVLCTSGPRDRPFEERHSRVSIAIVLAGSFQYRSASGRELMTPGSLLLGNPDQTFECAHEHGEGDRCLSFGYAPDYFGRLASDAGARGTKFDFRTLRVPPLRDLSPLTALGCAALVNSTDLAWEEFAIKLAARTIQLRGTLLPRASSTPANAEARVSRIVRTIERHPDGELTLKRLAQMAGLSPYHFLRTFERITGLTPHQHVLRTRLRAAAVRLAAEPGKVLDIALECGFGDASNFNRAFHIEFGASPREYRRRRGGL